MKCPDCGTEMRRTGERMGPSEFFVCLKCHPEYTEQVERYAAFCKELWAKHFATKCENKTNK